MSEDYATEHDEHTKERHEGHGKMCLIHDDHWQDDFAYVNDKRLPVPDDAPRTVDMAKLVATLDDAPIYRFLVVYVNAETGNIQVATSPSVSAPAGINLLTKAASIMSFQEAQEEAQAAQMISGAVGKAMRASIPPEEMSGFMALLQGYGNPDDDDDEPEIRQSRAANPDGYL